MSKSVLKEQVAKKFQMAEGKSPKGAYPSKGISYDCRKISTVKEAEALISTCKKAGVESPLAVVTKESSEK